MPANRNLRGGKGFKKGKKGGGGIERESLFDGRTAGQDYGRVIRILGNRRVVLYCNDGVERTCKIRGAMCRGPKKQIIGVGDVVLFSLRSFEDGSSSDDDTPVGIHSKAAGDTGDIILKYESNQWRQLRKEEGVNPHLFIDTASTAASGKQSVDDIFASEMGEQQAEEGEPVKVAEDTPVDNGEIDIDLI
jgi:translation initiation factor 1A